jgi:hypothetical protein
MFVTARIKHHRVITKTTIASRTPLAPFFLLPQSGDCHVKVGHIFFPKRNAVDMVSYHP